MDAAGIRPSRLAERAGRSRQNISDIRNEKVSPNIRDFGELLAIAEEMSPGFMERWVAELVGASDVFSAGAIANLDRKQLSMMLHLIADQLRPKSPSPQHQAKSKEEILAAS
ncbi:CinA family protein [Spirulina major]|uniref:CinA family protein n=1 Tax=Spirulina major TaxID=270636 RepID=UPI00111479FC|nr:CinA family protein [Spirulina major]